MPAIPKLENLRSEYNTLWASAEIRHAKLGAVDKYVDNLTAHQARYAAVAQPLGNPWQFVAVIHQLEAGASFKGHLHNGDPLTARTKHVPAGRPKHGAPPFTWEDSARDALALHGLDKWTDWTIPGVLFQLERYNGWGYRQYHPHVLSPYLWSFSQHYTSGKYVEDGKWSDQAVSAQCGAAVILLRMAQRGLYAPKPGPGANASIDWSKAAAAVQYDASGKKKYPEVERLQRFLNTVPGITLHVDGNPGPRTSAAVQRVLGFYLKGDPRQ
jgi:lysozyme family protein